ncbi:hypothetical protein H6P81_010010 [Aristolochia fimbriata]|uniref:Uncharacterized protein n=1 Tax=Aristolochia fimbriata TaxID=158543 RepID=A0AAV7EMI7_ARIFI|nr:hypothetical protein H6P81_010010 [Aristolochia fimbriata]
MTKIPHLNTEIVYTISRSKLPPRPRFSPPLARPSPSPSSTRRGKGQDSSWRKGRVRPEEGEGQAGEGRRVGLKEGGGSSRRRRKIGPEERED